MLAEITYNAGKSCTMKAVKFTEGQTKVITDPDIIRACQQTYGFAVQVLKEKKVVPVEEEETPLVPVLKKKVKHHDEAGR